MHKGALRKWRRVLAEQIFGASDIWRHFSLLACNLPWKREETSPKIYKHVLLNGE